MTITVGITGATGYVGSVIEACLRADGHSVVRLVRKPGPGDRYYELGSFESVRTLAGIDTLIHCAWDMRLSSWRDIAITNVEGSQRLLELAESAGVSETIFISSMSAFPGCKSLYGKAKLIVEKLFIDAGGIVIRPGLIYGADPGGMAGALTRLGRISPVLPMVGTGSYALHSCHEDDLGALLSYLCGKDPLVTGPITAAEQTPRRFRDIVQRLSSRHLYFIPIPWRIPWLLLRILEWVGVRTRLKSDSLVSLVFSDPAPDFAGLDELPIEFRQMADAAS